MPLSDTQHTLHGCIHLKGRARRSSKSNDGRKCVCTGKQSCSIHKLKIMTKIDVKNDVKFIVSSSFYSYNQHIHIYKFAHVGEMRMLFRVSVYMVMVMVVAYSPLMRYASNQGDASELPADIQNVFFFNKILTWVFSYACLLAFAFYLSLTLSLSLYVFFPFRSHLKLRMRHTIYSLCRQQHTHFPQYNTVPVVV